MSQGVELRVHGKQWLSTLFHSKVGNRVVFVTMWLGSNDAFVPGDQRHVPLKSFMLVTTVRSVVTLSAILKKGEGSSSFSALVL